MNLKKAQSWLVTLAMVLALIPPDALAAAEQAYMLTVRHICQNIAEDGTPGEEMEYEEATIEVPVTVGADITDSDGGKRTIAPLGFIEMDGKLYGIHKTDPMGVDSSTDWDFTVNEDNEIKGGSMPAADVVITYYYVELFTVTYLPGDYGLWEAISVSNLYHGDLTFEFYDDSGIDPDPNYIFIGWDIEDDNGVHLIRSEDIPPTVTGNVTYVAQWEENDFAYDVTYAWTNAPTIDDVAANLVPTLPAGSTDLLLDSDYTVDTTFTGETVIYSYDAYNNPTGKWTFSGWKLGAEPAPATLTMDSDKELVGTWTYEAIGVFVYDVTYAWTNAPTSDDVPANLVPTLPTGAENLPRNSNYTVDTTFTGETVIYSYDAYNNATGKWTFSGWKSGSDPAPVTLTMDSDKELVGTWIYEAIGVSVYDVTYTWTNAPTSDDVPANLVPTLPTGAANLPLNSDYTVDTTFTSETVIYSYDAYTNPTGKWTFSGWRLGTDPAPVTLTMDSDKELVGAWIYEAIGVSVYDVTYAWTNAPTSDDVAANLVPTLPEGAANLPLNSNYTVDTTFTGETVIYSYDAYSNTTGTWTFSGWNLGTEPAPATLTMDSDKELIGTWIYEVIGVSVYDVTYTWTNAPTSDDIAANLVPTLPAGAENLPLNSNYTVDTTFTSETAIHSYDEHGNIVGTWTFSGWKIGTEPASATLTMDSDKELVGAWLYEAIGVPVYDVTYAWTNAPTSDDVPANLVPTLPEGAANLPLNSNYTIDTTFTSETAIHSYDEHGNIVGTWTFSGWKLGADPAPATLTMDSDKELVGAWIYEAIGVPVYDVTYAWTNAPTSNNVAANFVPTLPAGAENLPLNSDYTVDTTFTGETVIYSYDAYSNPTGKWTFSGWRLGTEPAPATLTMDSDKALIGTWTYEAIGVFVYDVTYAWTNAPTSDDVAANLVPTLPTGAENLRQNSTYTVDTTFTSETAISSYDEHGNIVGTWTFSGWKLGSEPASATLTMDSNKKLVGEWTFTPVETAAPEATTYSIAYYYNGEMDETLTESNLPGEVGDEIRDFEHKFKDGFVFDYANPIILVEDPAENVLEIHYKPEDPEDPITSTISIRLKHEYYDRDDRFDGEQDGGNVDVPVDILFATFLTQFSEPSYGGSDYEARSLTVKEAVKTAYELTVNHIYGDTTDKFTDDLVKPGTAVSKAAIEKTDEIGTWALYDIVVTHEDFFAIDFRGKAVAGTMPKAEAEITFIYEFLESVSGNPDAEPEESDDNRLIGVNSAEEESGEIITHDWNSGTFAFAEGVEYTIVIQYIKAEPTPDDGNGNTGDDGGSGNSDGSETTPEPTPAPIPEPITEETIKALEDLIADLVGATPEAIIAEVANLLNDIESILSDKTASALLAEIEKAFVAMADITVEPPIIPSDAPAFLQEGASKISVVGAAFNAAAGQKVGLKVTAPTTAALMAAGAALAAVDITQYDTATIVPLEINLEVDDVEQGVLTYPISITIPIPPSISAANLYILHISTDGAVELITPKDNGDGTCTFTVTHFSTFAFVEKITSVDPVTPVTPPVTPPTTGTTTGGGSSGGGSSGNSNSGSNSSSGSGSSSGSNYASTADSDTAPPTPPINKKQTPLATSLPEPVTIMNEEMPLADLPTTGGAAKKVSSVAGFLAILGGLFLGLIGLKKDDEE
jgi:hypothetical protein